MSDAEQTTPLNEQSTSQPPLLLEAPPEDSGAQKLGLGSGQTLRFDALGPMIVNSNGTLSRISNWSEMTDIERARTVRILLKRNQIRLADQENKSAQDSAF